MFASLYTRELWLRHLMLIACWLLLWRISVLMEYAPHASLWFPPAGLSFAALLVFGIGAVLPLLVCAVASTFWMATIYATEQSWSELFTTGILFGIAHCTSYGLGALALRFTVTRIQSNNLPQTVISFLLLGSLSALLATILGTQALALAGTLARADIQQIWLAWWVGDMAGTLVLAPFFIALMSWRYEFIKPWLGGLDLYFHHHHKSPYLIKLALCAGLLSAAMLLIALLPHPESAFSVFFLIIPQMWVVYSESPFRAIVSLALFSFLVALWVATLGLIDQALVFQFAITVIAASAYFGLAVPVLTAHNQRLRELAFVDGLTKVSTRDYFFEQAHIELLRCRRFGLPLCLMVFDIDHFKFINDQYGHSAGDRALIQTANAIQHSLRQTDLLGRFGGDEFMILLPDNNLNQAYETAERLRRVMGQTPLPGSQHTLSGSFGLVQLQPDESLSSAFERADAALLAAKKNGKNQIDIGPSR